MAKLNLKSVVRQEPSVLSASLDTELVLLSIAEDRYFGSGDVGRRIWELCASPTSIEAVVATLMTEFDVSADVCERDVLLYLEHMLSSRLILTVGN